MRSNPRPLPILSLLLAAGAVAPPARGSDQDLEPPNLLWIIAEDMGCELSCYGHPEVHTPNLDGLAREGVRFSHCFTTAPVCSPSRSAIMTGMYQISIGAHNHRSHRDDGFALPEGVQVLTDWLRSAGYFTANVRHLRDDKQEKFFRGTGKTDWNFHYDGKPFDSDRWSEVSARQPFYAQVNFSETHRGGAWDTSHQHIEKTADPDRVVIPPYYPDHPLTRKDWAQYLNTVMALDRKVGFVLDLLREADLLEKTVVLFFADHGRAMIRGKQWPYDSGLHVPLIVRWPQGFEAPAGLPKRGTVDSRLVASIDLTATTLALAGVSKPPRMQGRVLFGPQREAERTMVFGGRDRGDETVFRIRTARNRRYRYLKNFMPERPFLQLNRYKEWAYPVLGLMRQLHDEGKLSPPQEVLFAPSRPPEELYDLEADPYEIRNLAGSTEHQEVLARMRVAVEHWIVEADDQGRIPEPPEVLQHWERQMQKNYDKRLQQRREKRGGVPRER